MKIGLCTELRIGMNQQQVQSLEILALNTAELDALVRSEEMENPFFEVQEDYFVEQKQAAWLENSRNPRTVMATEDGPLRQMEAPEENKLRVHLWAQIDWNHYTLEMQQVLRVLLKCIDDRGLITDTAEELAEYTGRSVQEVQEAFLVIQGLDPAGVGAESVGHCLMLQMERQGVYDAGQLQAVRYHLEDLARGRFGVVSQQCGITSAQARDILRQLKSLNPNPAAGFAEDCCRYIVPDVIADRIDDKWKIEINDRWMGSVGISDYYCKMAQQSEDAQLKEYALKKIARAKFIISCVEKRRSTLAGVVGMIVQEQTDFLLGQGNLSPLSIRQIAEALKMHPSTVGRAIRGKYLQCRRGCFAISELLTAVVGESGEKAIGKAEVLERMRDLVQQEDKAHPLSDENICHMLSEQGIQISRRTVAKYRELLGIAGMFQRRVT